jgi:hypothetical protein
VTERYGREVPRSNANCKIAQSMDVHSADRPSRDWRTGNELGVPEASARSANQRRTRSPKNTRLSANRVFLEGLPALLFPQLRDVRGVMLAVPCVEK